MDGLDGLILWMDGLDVLLFLDGWTGCYKYLGRTGQMPIEWDGLDVGRTIDHTASKSTEEQYLYELFDHRSSS